jgi:lipoprotein-anchoring transpeptidase ErfK/SrfK
MRNPVTFALVFLIAGTVLGATPHTPPHRGSADRLRAQRPPSINALDVNNPNQPELEQGARGSGVVRGQVLLDRAHFSCGALDGNFGSNLAITVSAYQHDRRLEQSGKLDSATWASLNSDTAPATMSYTITADDEKGPFVSVPRDMLKQAKLPYLGYASALDELSERFHSSPTLIKALNPDADFTMVGQQLTVPNVMTMPPAGNPDRIFVSKNEKSVRVYDADGKLMAFYMATIGSTHDPLPLGNWKVTTVQQNPEFHYDAKLFWDAKDPDERATIKPGPRNPVGVAKVGISKPHYGIHGTPDATKIGHNFSHGCIRLPNWDAWELTTLAKPGMPVILKE